MPVQLIAHVTDDPFSHHHAEDPGHVEQRVLDQQGYQHEDDDVAQRDPRVCPTDKTANCELQYLLHQIAGRGQHGHLPEQRP